MVRRVELIDESLRDLPRLSADELAARLKAFYECLDGLVFSSDIEVGREAVRRARRAEQAEAELRRAREKEKSHRKGA